VVRRVILFRISKRSPAKANSYQLNRDKVIAIGEFVDLVAQLCGQAHERGRNVRHGGAQRCECRSESVLALKEEDRKLRVGNCEFAELKVALGIHEAELREQMNFGRNNRQEGMGMYIRTISPKSPRGGQEWVS